MTFPSVASRRAVSPVLAILLSLIALVAVVGPALVVAFGPRVVAIPHLRRAPVRVVPQAELPPVEPVEFQALPPAEARAFNATVPFSTGPNPAARPFRFAGSEDARARATDCLAAAMLYEAGDDPAGERAVGQVVINRARHPAFPKTICGVVFQGSERATGCQFTFTCDGAMARRPSESGWTRARALAAAALSGSVYAAVGHATHYHTDWVVPYWQSSLDKVAAVHTHLFFRWTGWWGTPPAFRRAVSGDEPVIPQLGLLSDAHRTAAAYDEAGVALAAGQAALAGATAPGSLDPNVFLVTLDRKTPAELLPQIAQRTCGARDYCKFMVWTDKSATPGALPLGAAQIATMAFSYLRDRAHNYDKPLWNCAVFKRAEPTQCMKVQLPVSTRDPLKIEDMFSARALPPMVLPAADGVVPPPVVPTVRRKPAAAPAAPPAQAATNISGGNAINASDPASIFRRSAPASGNKRSE